MICKRLILLGMVVLQYAFVSSYCCLGSSPWSPVDFDQVHINYIQRSPYSLETLLNGEGPSAQLAFRSSYVPRSNGTVSSQCVAPDCPSVPQATYQLPATISIEAFYAIKFYHEYAQFRRYVEKKTNKFQVRACSVPPNELVSGDQKILKLSEELDEKITHAINYLQTNVADIRGRLINERGFSPQGSNVTVCDNPLVVPSREWSYSPPLNFVDQGQPQNDCPLLTLYIWLYGEHEQFKICVKEIINKFQQITNFVAPETLFSGCQNILVLSGELDAKVLSVTSNFLAKVRNIRAQLKHEFSSSLQDIAEVACSGIRKLPPKNRSYAPYSPTFVVHEQPQEKSSFESPDHTLEKNSPDPADTYQPKTSKKRCEITAIVDNLSRTGRAPSEITNLKRELEKYKVLGVGDNIVGRLVMHIGRYIGSLESDSRTFTTKELRGEMPITTAGRVIVFLEKYCYLLRNNNIKGNAKHLFITEKLRSLIKAFNNLGSLMVNEKRLEPLVCAIVEARSKDSDSEDVERENATNKRKKPPQPNRSTQEVVKKHRTRES